MNKTEWKELTPKQQWDVIVAMRGPDVKNSESIKWLTTAVLRSAMSETIRVGGTINNDLKMVVVPANHYVDSFVVSKPTKESMESVPPYLRFSPSHFFQHVVEAAEILGLPALQVEKSVWVKAYQEDHGFAYVVINLLEGIEEYEAKVKKGPSIGYPFFKHPPELVKILEAHAQFLNGRG